jgi:hypothetical protein
MPPAEALKIWQREYTDALASGDKDRIGAATRALELAEAEARTPQPFIDPIDQETMALGMDRRRQAEIEKMLFNGYMEGGTGKPAFFTNVFNRPRNDDPDQAAFKNLQKFGEAPEGTEANKNYWTSIGILSQFPESVRQQVNESNEINTTVNNSMSDETGKTLVRAMLALAEKMGVEIKFEIPGM